ncbi:MAG: metallopeptidase TldD-related protein, partial [Planctomycetota bacterium]
GRALGAVLKADDVIEAEVFASANEQRVARLSFTSHIPSNGVEEPKSVSAFGLCVEAVFRSPVGPVVGFGFETADLSERAALAALERARRGAVADEDFVSLPVPADEERKLAGYHDRALMELSDEDLVALGWRSVDSALAVFEGSGRLRELSGGDPAKLGLILGGDVTVLAERIAVASSLMREPRTDESSLLLAAHTAMVEEFAAKGSGWFASARLADYRGEAAEEAARNAVLGVGARRIPSGTYRVVLGPQAVSDLLNNLVMPSLSLDVLHASSSAFLGKLGSRLAAAELSIYDDGARRGGVASKGITCEGLPTGRTDLIRDGVFVGTLANFYSSRRILRDKRAREKLGIDPASRPEAFVPRNGFRFVAGGGRSHEMRAGISPTNVFVESRAPVGREELLRRVGEGVYIGRIWYTYPSNGLAAGDFTATVVADSFLIRDGVLAEPVAANCVRINDNVRSVLASVVGVSDRARPVVVWAADEVVHAPEVAVAGLKLQAIDEPSS